ncbi:MAG: hypothetical protein Q7S11_02405 [bacterium]|nr:hypothetical protein [bacterium]
MIRIIKNILRHPAYIAISLGVAFTAFAFVMWLPNISFISSVFENMNVSWSDKIIFLFILLESITTNFTVLGAFSTVLIALLFGIQIALTAYLLIERSFIVAGKSTVASATGVGMGLLGIGCSACGSLILTAILPAIGVSGVLALLPLGGAEFSLLGVLMIALSVFFTARYIMRPAVCNPKS